MLLIAGSFLLAKNYIFVSPERECATYYGGNPHLERSKILAKYEAGFGIVLFVIGSAIQIYLTRFDFAKLFFNMIVPMILLTCYIAYQLMKREFHPKLKKDLLRDFQNAKYVLQNNGIYETEKDKQGIVISEEQRRGRIESTRENMIDWASMFNVKIKDKVSNEELIKIVDERIFS